MNHTRPSRIIWIAGKKGSIIGVYRAENMKQITSYTDTEYVPYPMPSTSVMMMRPSMLVYLIGVDQVFIKYSK